METENNSMRYRLADSEIAADGAVILRLTTKDPSQARWGEFRRCQAGFPDYAFWRWVLDHKHQWADTVSEEDISRMRLQYEKSLG
jgi:hypothetical protein